MIQPTDTLALLSWLLISLSGDTVEIGSFRGQPAVVHIWATWCEPCVRELRRLEKWWKNEQRRKPSEKKVNLLVVSPEDRKHVSEFVRRHRYKLPFYVEHTRIPKEYGVKVLPTTLLLDKKGNILKHLPGEQEWKVLSDSIKKVGEKKTPPD